MTLIGIATYGKYAEFITDTMSYNPNARTLGRTTKSRTLNHIDAAILTQGNAHFGDLAKATLSVLADNMPDFDGLVETAPTALCALWESQDSWGVYGGTVFLVGYSPEAAEFRAFSLAFDRNRFSPEPIMAPHVMPSPFTVAPSPMELDRLTKTTKKAGAGADYMRAFTEVWPSRPILRAPKNKTEWQRVAMDCREQRALDQGRTRTFVGGDVHHTRLSRGKVSSHVIHTYNDSGDELARMVAGTVHPIAQRGPCACGSGKSYRECCLVPHLDTPCNCDSGLTLGDCCAIELPPATVKAH